LLAAALPAVGAPPAPDGKDEGGAFPRRQFHALPEKAVGVLVAGDEEVLGREGRKGPADAYGFARGGDSYRWLFVPVDKKWLLGGYFAPVGPRGDTLQRFRHLSFASPKTVERWGVSGPYALVEAEVNGGRGGPPGEIFVATNLRVLDGTKDYPLHVGKAVEDMRHQFRRYLQLHQDTITAALYDARQRVPAGHQLVAGRDQTETVFVSWLPETEKLRIIFETRITEKALATARPAPPPPPPANKEDVAPPPPVHEGVRLGVEVVVTYEVSKRGLLDGSRELPLRPYQKELQAPAPKPVATGGPPAGEARIGGWHP
jgi:hypothetical protein